MPVSPELGEKLAARVLRIYAQAEETLLTKVARRIERGIDEDGWAERKLAELAAMRREAKAVVTELDKAGPDEIATVVEDAYTAGVAEARKDLKKLSEGFNVSTNPALVNRLAHETVTRVQSTHLRILRTADDIYRTTIADASTQVATGAITRREAAQKALSSFADAGVKGFIDSSGRAWDLSSYAEMAVRSSTGRAAVGGHAESLQDNGQDLVMISDAPEECELCRPWEGKVVSLSGTNKKYPSLGDAEADGLFHPGCRHDIEVFIEGVTRPMQRTADPVGLAQRVEQRRLERGVRQWKRRTATAITESERVASTAKVSEWQNRLKTFVVDNDRKQLAYRTSLGAR
jgi:hypothetical protein